jgi:hypothetical protein
MLAFLVLITLSAILKYESFVFNKMAHNRFGSVVLRSSSSDNPEFDGKEFEEVLKSMGSVWCV